MTTSLKTPVSIATSSADCDTNYKVQSSATLTELGSPFLSYTADLSAFPDVSVVIDDSTKENMCLTYPDGKPGTTDSTEDSTPTSVEVSLSLSLSGITCEEYGAAEEAAVNVALAALIVGADAETFTDHECATGVTVVVDASRRALLSNAVTISTSVTVATDTYASASASDVATSVNSALDAVVTSGAFTTSVVSAGEAGGLSGKPLTEKATEVIGQLRAALPDETPIIGVGGIMTGEDAAEKLRAGATLIQVYSGFIYRGPALLKEIFKSLQN